MTKGDAKTSSQWRARIAVEGKMRSLGRYATQSAAAQAYDAYVVGRGITDRALNFPFARNTRRAATMRIALTAPRAPRTTTPKARSKYAGVVRCVGNAEQKARGGGWTAVLKRAGEATHRCVVHFFCLLFLCLLIFFCLSLFL